MKTSVKEKLLAMISALILVSVMAVTVLTYQNYRADLVAQSTQATRQLLEQLAINVDTYLDELFRLCLSPYYNKAVMEQLELAPSSAAAKLQKRRVIEGYLSEMMTLPRSDILRAHILSGEIYSSSKTRYGADIPGEYREESWYVEAMNSKEAVFVPAHTEAQGKAALSVFSVAQRVNSTKDSSKVLGVIRVDANYNGIKAVCDRAGTGQGSGLYILDSAANVIYANDRTGGALRETLRPALASRPGESAFTLSLGKAEYLVSVQALHVTDWRIIDVHSMQALTAAATQARNKAFGLAFLCAVLGVLVSVPLVRRFLRPILRITGLMRSAQGGDLTVRASAEGHDELAYLARSFNEMLAQIQEETQRNNLLTRQVYEARYLEKEAQYAALCNQIRPHFLFNALNTIHLLIKTGRGEEAVQCIHMLATLLRGMVNADREITLGAEMKIVESYLTLQQKRYASLRHSLPQDPGPWSEYLLPALTLQPIVENAVVYGCEPKRGSTHIEVSLEETEEELRILIQDNGMGMAADKLAALREALAESTVEPSPNETGVGLVNISRRVKLKFGQRYGLTIESRPGEGTRVTLHLPLKGETPCTER
ncbi:MAG: sensor histidine kinase [Candidatus Limiplasma sp.]|nr:sensor histidine kinase [Candidatus Limiplasma sp.]